MGGAFRVLTTPSFEREFRRTSNGNPALITGLEELVAILRQDPHNRSGRYAIKKLASLRSGDGQWRIRLRDYRLRYDIEGQNVVLHSFRHRKHAY